MRILASVVPLNELRLSLRYPTTASSEILLTAVTVAITVGDNIEDVTLKHVLRMHN